MKAKAIEIRWHDTQPVFSADFHSIPPEEHRKILHPYAKAALNAGLGTTADPLPSVEEDKMWRLATAGGDKNVRVSSRGQIVSALGPSADGTARGDLTG